MKIHRIYKKPIDEGFYIYSSSGCGDSCAIRMEYVETPDQCASFSFDTDFARALAHALLEISDNYDKGIETGISPKGYK